MSQGLQEAIDGFLRYLKVERQLSPLTQSSYARQLAALAAIAGEMKLSSW
ncbi:site-specific integrase, partial [Pantoea deleyi]